MGAAEATTPAKPTVVHDSARHAALTKLIKAAEKKEEIKKERKKEKGSLAAALKELAAEREALHADEQKKQDEEKVSLTAELKELKALHAASKKQEEMLS